MYSVVLKKGREASLVRRHPWIYSGAIARVNGSPPPGVTVRVVSSDGECIGVGGYSPHSQIRVRMYAYEEIEFDLDFQRQAVARALARREALYQSRPRSTYRLVYGESDGLPGLVVDRYENYLVCQFLFAGMEMHRDSLVEALVTETGCDRVYERSDVAVRDKEGLPARRGPLLGPEPPERLELRIDELVMAVNLREGHKTGLYLDQVENQRLVGASCHGQSLLNCFAYTGGFSLAALVAGAAEVISVDSSADALAVAVENLGLNGLDGSRHQAVQGNVFDLLREYQRQGRHFDVVILDPPKFAENRKQLMKAARAYKDLALQAAKIISPGGRLVNFSCSGAMELSLFQKITADALLDAGRSGVIVQYLHQSPDHPVALNFPESQYLKGLISRLD